jgi:putative tryptophan/tyrosine transport system substrate-binding protein
MRRREFTATLCAGILWPLAAHAQSGRVIFLTNVAANDPEGQRNFTALVDGLKDRGWAADRNLAVEFRGIGGNVGLAQSYVAQALAARPDVIVSSSGPILLELEKQTRSVPIIFVEVMDPVAGGFVQSLPKPGRNITGFTNFEPAFGGKWLEILRDISPDVARVIVLLNPDVSPQHHVVESIRKAAEGLGIETSPAGVHNAGDIEQALRRGAGDNRTGVIVLPNPITIANRASLVRIANDVRLPAIYPNKYFAEIGGLVSYGVDLVTQYREAAGYVDRILQGQAPGELPVQAPTKFELVINLKTAKSLGLPMSPLLLARADEVIE